jgi:hypothetical protein
MTEEVAEVKVDEQEETPPKVLISIPTKDQIYAQTVGWLLQAQKNAPIIGYGIKVQIIQSPYPIEMQRNNQVKNFLAETDCTHLFLLDSDCVPPDLCIERLLDYDLDIVTSVAPALIGGTQVFTAALGADTYEDGSPKFNFPGVSEERCHGLKEIDGCGATGVLIKRHVLETIPPPWFKMQYKDDGCSMYLGEDYWFCDNAKKYGFKLWADFDLRQTHIKMIAL